MKLISKFYRHISNDSLYRNSIYLMLSTAVMAFFGFFFWIINARLFKPEQVGISTALISVMSLLSSFSLLGLGNGLIRYLPMSERKNQKINTSFTLVAVASVLMALTYLIFINTFSPKLLFVRENIFFAILFVLFIVFSSLNTISEYVFIAYRASKYVLIKSTIFSIAKLALPILLISFGAYGIFMSVGISIVIAFMLSLLFLVVKFGYIIRPTINKEVVKRVTKFSLGNYIGNIFGILPGTFVPIMVVTQLGPTKGAFFYMPLMISAFLNIIPSATAQSLFAEASHEENRLNYYFWHAIKNVFLLLIPAVIFVILFANVILSFFGANYAAEGSNVLIILALASLVGAANYIGDTLLNIKKLVSLYVFMNIFNSLSIVFLVYFLAPKGLVWVAYAGLIGQVLTLIVYIIINRKIIVQYLNFKPSLKH